MSDKAAACCRVRMLLVVAQNLAQEVDVACCQAKCLYLWQLIRRQSGDDLPQFVECFVQCLCSLSFTYVRHCSLVAFRMAMIMYMRGIFAFRFRTTCCSVLSPGLCHGKRLLIMRQSHGLKSWAHTNELLTVQLTKAGYSQPEGREMSV